MKDISNIQKPISRTQKIFASIIKWLLLAIYILVLVYFFENYGTLGIGLWLLLTIILGVLIILMNWTAYKNIVDYGTMIIRYKQGWYDKDVKKRPNRKTK